MDWNNTSQSWTPRATRLFLRNSPKGLHERLLKACLDVAERRNGERPDLETGKTHENFKGLFAAMLGENDDSPIGDLMQSLIFEDEVFEEALMNPVLLTLASYLCGYSVVLSSMGCFMKGPNKTSFTLHTDTPMPSPLPPHSMVCNLTYVLTEFNKGSGSTAFVPGSHKWCRGPEASETSPDHNSKAVAVEAEPGSLLVWHGNTLAWRIQPNDTRAARERSGVHGPTLRSYARRAGWRSPRGDACAQRSAPWLASTAGRVLRVQEPGRRHFTRGARRETCQDDQRPHRRRWIR
jgi:hypothetical protein